MRIMDPDDRSEARRRIRCSFGVPFHRPIAAVLVSTRSVFRWLAWLLAGLSTVGLPADPVGLIHPPLGPNVGLTAADFAGSHSFTGQDRLVLTPYFYWYDIFDGAHITDADGSDALTDHPPTLTGFSYRSKSWHRGELKDMAAAGIDVVLPVHWGEPSQRLAGKPVDQQPWSYAGLGPLVQAREELVAEGGNPPFIGMFYDTSTLQFNAANEHIDLTTPHGREWFYESIRDFFSLIPPKHWAMIDGRPVVFLYSAAFAIRHDASCIAQLRSCFAADFGGRTPFIVREISWNVVTDDVYAWGGALGLKNPGLASLGPGYDDSAVEGRVPLIVPRENGAFFEHNWLRFLARPSRRVFIETWNEFHEGTDIAHSKEYGTQYLTLNRKYADLFKSGYRPPRPTGPFTGVRLVQIALGVTNRTQGVVQLEGADGVTIASNLGGLDCRVVAPNANPGRYVYFRIDDSFKWADAMEVSVVVDYYDSGVGTLGLQYDGADPNAPFQGAYTASSNRVTLVDGNAWKTAVFRLGNARFLNSQNGGADFRLDSSLTGLGIRRVQVVRSGLECRSHSPQSGTELRLFGEPGLLYGVEASTNLSAWNELTRLRLADTSVPFSDVAARGFSFRWYRLKPY